MFINLLKKNKKEREFYKKYFKAVFLGILFWTFFLKSYSYLDPDFGWRIRSGLLYLSEGIPKTDPFTYTMPSFPWVDHAWLSTTLMGALFGRVGILGLAVLFSSVALGALLVIFSFTGGRGKLFDKSYYSNPIFILTAGALLPFVGIRAQVITWLFFAVFIKVLLDQKLWVKYRLLVPIFFLAWANFHGGFASGLVAFAIVVGVKVITTKRVDWYDVLVFVISSVLTLINPYGVGVWREVWSSVSDNSLRWTIVEWTPSVFRVDFAFMLLIGLSVVFLKRYGKFIKIEKMVLFVLFLFQALLSNRHIPLWAFVAAPLLMEFLVKFFNEVKNYKYGKERFIKVYKVTVVVSYLIFLVQLVVVSRGVLGLNEDNFYPAKAVVYLRENSYKGETFSLYGWGGYLVWKYPERKVFIDGRMPSWKWKDAPDSESVYVFDEYNKMLSGEKDYKLVFNKYDVRTVLWPKPKDEENYIMKKAELMLKRLLGKDEEEFDFLGTLEIDRWEKVYEDNASVVYRKL